jgi:hypothetical protein
MILVDAWYSDPVRAQTKDFSISESGQVTGDENGTVIGLSRNRLLYRSEDVLTTVFANPTGDVLVESKREPDLQDINIALKKPESLTLAELAGAWSLISVISPDDLTTVGNLSDVYFEGESSVTKGEIQLNSNGTFGGLFSATATVNGTSLVVTTGAGPITFRVNQGKNLAIATLEQSDEAEIVFFVRKPDSLTTGQLAGTWRFNVLVIPASLTETYFNTQTGQARQVDSDDFAGPNEVLVDLFHRGRFELERGNLRVQANGSVVESIVESLSVGPDQTVLVHTADEILSFVINEDRSVMVGAFGEEDDQRLIVVVKTDETTATSEEEALDLVPVQAGENFVLSWAGATGVTMQVATGDGTFTEVDGSLAQDAILIDTSIAPRAIFRLFQEAEQEGN